MAGTVRWVAAALVALPLTAAPAFAVAPGADGLCGPDAPDAYKRPGGYCDTLDQGGSLSVSVRETVVRNAVLLPPEVDAGPDTPCAAEAVVC